MLNKQMDPCFNSPSQAPLPTHTHPSWNIRSALTYTYVLCICLEFVICHTDQVVRWQRIENPQMWNRAKAIFSLFGR